MSGLSSGLGDETRDVDLDDLSIRSCTYEQHVGRATRGASWRRIKPAAGDHRCHRRLVADAASAPQVPRPGHPDRGSDQEHTGGRQGASLVVGQFRGNDCQPDWTAAGVCGLETRAMRDQVGRVVHQLGARERRLPERRRRRGMLVLAAADRYGTWDKPVYGAPPDSAVLPNNALEESRARSARRRPRPAALESVISCTVRDTAAFPDVTSGSEGWSPFAVAPPQRPYRDEVRRRPGRLRLSSRSPVDTPPCSRELLRRSARCYGSAACHGGGVGTLCVP